MMRTSAEIIGELAGELAMALKSAIDRNGTNTKVGRNTLKDSDLIDSVEAKVSGGVIEILANHYIEYIEFGRRPKAKWVPISALVEWASRKGIPTDNHTIYAIAYAIWRDGIPPRPVLHDYYNNSVDEIIDKFCEQLKVTILNYIEYEYNR